MSKRHQNGSPRTKRAAAIRLLVFDLLGGRCVVCGNKHGLEVDIKVSGAEKHHDLGTYRRWVFYLKAAREQRAQLLCVLHHREKSRVDLAARRRAASADVVPFEVPSAGGSDISSTCIT